MYQLFLGKVSIKYILKLLTLDVQLIVEKKYIVKVWQNLIMGQVRWLSKTKWETENKLSEMMFNFVWCWNSVKHDTPLESFPYIFKYLWFNFLKFLSFSSLHCENRKLVVPTAHDYRYFIFSMRHYKGSSP